MAAQPAPAPAPADDLIELKVDGKTVRVPKGSNLLQACEAAGVSVPRCVWLGSELQRHGRTWRWLRGWKIA